MNTKYFAEYYDFYRRYTKKFFLNKDTNTILYDMERGMHSSLINLFYFGGFKCLLEEFGGNPDFYIYDNKLFDKYLMIEELEK